MSSSTVSPIKTEKARFEVANLSQGLASTHSQSPTDSDSIKVKQYHPDFQTIIGRSPVFSLLISSAGASSNPFFSHGCTFRDGCLYVMSDLLQPTSSSMMPVVLISQIVMSNKEPFPGSVIFIRNQMEWQKLRPPPSMPMPAGAINFRDGTLFCSQGVLKDTDSGGLWYMPLRKPPRSVLRGFVDRNFNSVHDVVQDSRGALWFTDPCLGFEKGFRPAPKLPSQVYRYDPDTEDLRVVAGDGLARPTGITLSPDEEVMYITDTEAACADGTFDQTKAATIYAYDVVHRSGAPFLANRRTFARALEGVPKSVICDGGGNVYAACGDGVEVWNAAGRCLGVIAIPGGCSTMCFGEPRANELFIGAGQRLFRFQFDRVSPMLF